jgi:Protein of unknown function (DUF4236)
MGFYLRKSFGFGPFRLNLSKSGLGASFGVKGARIGVNPKGRVYVHAGRAGFYFRESLQPAPSERRPATPRAPSTPVADEPIRQIESGASWSLTDEAQTELVAELTRVHRRTSRRLIVGIIAAIVMLGLGATLAVAVNIPEAVPVPLPPVVWATLMVVAGIGIVFAFLRGRAADERDGKVNLSFDLEPDAAERVTALSGALDRLAVCERVWVVETEQKIGDWKRNAGATNLVKRTQVQPSAALPRGVESTHEIMCLPAGRQKLYFFPNALMVYDSAGVGAISYNRLKCEAGAVAFTEEEGVPSDGQVLRHTWRYVNKKGGPDRRFSNNQELPVMRYGGVALTSDTGLNELFHTSNPEVVEPLQQALDALRAVRVEARRDDGD